MAAARKKKEVEDPTNTWDMQLMAAALRKDTAAIAPLLDKATLNMNHLAQDTKVPGATSTSAVAVTPFAAACLHHGDIDVLKYLVAHGANPNAPIGSGGNTVFHHLVVCEQLEALDKLCAKRLAISPDFSIDSVNKSGQTALQEALSRNLPDYARVLIKHGASTDSFRENVVSDYNQAARACILGDLQKLETLLGAGDSPLQLDCHGGTLLHLSIGFPGVLDFLVERGVSINALDAKGDTVLTAALKSKKPSLETIEQLIGRGADVNLGDSTFGMTPLMLAIHGYFPEIVRKLLGPEVRAEVNTRDTFGGTALHWAVSARLKGCLELLLQTEGVDVNAADACGETALHRAASRGRVDAVQQLLGHPLTDVNLQDRDGRNALHLAVEVADVPCARLLTRRAVEDPASVQAAAAAANSKKPPAKRGGPTSAGEAAPINLKLELEAVDKADETALQMAVRLNNTAMAELLVESGSKTKRFDKSGCSLLHLAVRNNNDGLVKVLLERGADPCAHDAAELAPLHLAALNGNTEIARLVLASGAVADDQEKAFLRSPLHIACEQGDVALAALLVGPAGKASVHLTDGGINTPLHVACDTQCLPLVQLLLANGALLNVSNARGCTPLHCSCSAPAVNGDGAALIELLLANKCPLLEMDEKGWTPLHTAVASNAVHAVPLLLAAASKDPDIDIIAWLSLADKADRYPLLLAAEAGSVEAAKLIIRARRAADAAKAQAA